MSDDASLDEFNELVKQGRSSGDTCRGDIPPALNAVGGCDVVESDKQTGNMSMWAMYGSDKFGPCEQAVDLLPPGQYTVEHSNSIGIYFQRTNVNLDELISLPDSISNKVVDEIENFWTYEDRFRKFGFMWKRGVLLWGPPGSGKTSTLQVISKNIIDKGGMSVYVDRPGLAAEGLRMFRQIEPKRPIVVMLEDVDAILDRHGESEMLALMDGELQIDNVVFIATTNYPERLDKRFVNRPSRFDLVEKIDMPSAAARRVFLKAKNPKFQSNAHDSELEMWVKETAGFSVAHMKELIISVEVFGKPFKSSVQRLSKMMNIPSSTESSNGFGFTRTISD